MYHNYTAEANYVHDDEELAFASFNNTYVTTMLLCFHEHLPVKYTQCTTRNNTKLNEYTLSILLQVNHVYIEKLLLSTYSYMQEFKQIMTVENHIDSTKNS